MKTLLIAVMISAGFTAAVPAQSIAYSRSEIISLKSYRAFCEGVVPKKCLVVRREGEEEFRPIFDEIENFNFIPGYEYDLKVRVEKLTAAPKDTSGFRFYLKEIISRKEISGSERSVHLFGNKWRLSVMLGVPVKEPGPFIVFAGPDGTAYGATGCNSFRGSYDLSRDSLKFSPIAMTRRACFRAVIDEDAFVRSLAKIDSVLVEPDRLYLRSGGSTLLEFEPNE